MEQIIGRQKNFLRGSGEVSFFSYMPLGLIPVFLRMTLADMFFWQDSCIPDPVASIPILGAKAHSRKTTRKKCYYKGLYPNGSPFSVRENI